MIAKFVSRLTPVLTRSPSELQNCEYGQMSRPKRYFVNNLPDYKGGDVKIPGDFLLAHIDDTSQNILNHQKISSKECEGSVYTGIAGVAYAFYRLHENEHVNKGASKGHWLATCDKFIKGHFDFVMSGYNRCTPREKTGFLEGNIGVLTVAALVAKAKGNNDSLQKIAHLIQEGLPLVKPTNYLPGGCDELFVGRAGVLSALKILRDNGIQIANSTVIKDLCQITLESGISYAKRHHSPAPLMYSYYDTEYLGAAHGLCTILLMLLNFPEFWQADTYAERTLKRSVDFLLNTQQNSGNFPCAMDELQPGSRPESEELIHWCHGATGVIYVMAKAYGIWNEEKYLTSCLRCGEVIWQRGLLKKGPGICHGSSGSGYAFLLLYRLTGDKKHLHRAVEFARFTYSKEFQEGARTPDKPYSLFEGLAGTMCFLTDLLRPNRAEFPLYPCL